MSKTKKTMTPTAPKMPLMLKRELAALEVQDASKGLLRMVEEFASNKVSARWMERYCLPFDLKEDCETDERVLMEREYKDEINTEHLNLLEDMKKDLVPRFKGIKKDIEDIEKTNACLVNKSATLKKPKRN